MKISVVFVSNYLTIHQIALCKSFYENDEISFSFVSSFKPSGDKVAFSNYENEPFVLRAYDSKTERKRIIKVINSADFIIFGAGDRTLLKNKKKNIFFYSEHLRKKKITFLRKLHLRFIYKKYRNAYLLCASSFAANDFNDIGLFKNRCLYFGYFPTLIPNEHKYTKDFLRILWVGRELELKHPEYAFYAAEWFYKHSANFEVCIISTKNSIINNLLIKAKKEPWFNNIQLMPTMSNEAVQQKMSSSDFFIFSSDINEGWGAVVNEAMNAGCCPIISKQAGCCDFLIKDRINGLSFKDKIEFEHKLKLCLDNEFYKEVGLNAQTTIRNVWNEKIATKNLCDVFKSILSKTNFSSDLFNNGPGTFIK